MAIYEDFLYYGHGVYSHCSGSLIGFESVLLVGWDEMDGVPYWIVRANYGPRFGNLDGYFYILKGWDEVGIESNGYLGLH